MNILESPIFYMGNKYKLLKQMLPLFPKNCDTFYDLFGGSGVVSMNYKGKIKNIYNELNPNIVELVKMVVNNNIDELDKYYKDKIKEYKLETCSIKAKDRQSREGYNRRKDSYNRLRDDYNKSTKRDYRDLFLLICYSINHLIRFNKNNEFNVSSGADSYNEKNYKKLKNMQDKFKTIEIWNKNIFDINFNEIGTNDFVYLDPPYSNTEAVYNEKRAFGGWTIDHDKQLFSICEELNKRNIKWGISNVFINRNKKNTHLIEWCNKNKWNIKHLNRNYNPFSRGNSNNDEVYICNYIQEEYIDDLFGYRQWS